MNHSNQEDHQEEGHQEDGQEEGQEEDGQEEGRRGQEIKEGLDPVADPLGITELYQTPLIGYKTTKKTRYQDNLHDHIRHRTSLLRATSLAFAPLRWDRQHRLQASPWLQHRKAWWRNRRASTWPPMTPTISYGSSKAVASGRWRWKGMHWHRESRCTSGIGKIWRSNFGVVQRLMNKMSTDC
jgi:hypothetical protein